MAYTRAQLLAAYTAANNGVAPDTAAKATIEALADQTAAGTATDTAALAVVINSAQDDVEVAVQAYQFFTGKSPSKAGLDFLTNSTDNATDLNDPYYLQFNLENRYINFAANLGLFGEGAAAFATTYASLGFAAFVDIAYETIIGSGYAMASGINVVAAKADIVGRLANFQQLARDRALTTAASTPAQVDLAVKASVIGYLMAEGVKADVGIYAASANNFVNALVNGNATFNTDLIATYAALGGGTGSPVAPALAPGGGGTPPGTTLDVAGGTASLVLSNVEPATTLRITGSFTAGHGLTVMLKDATGTADTVALAFVGGAPGAGQTLPFLAAPGAETVTISSAGATGSANNTIGKLTADASLTTVKITGAGPFSLTTDALTRNVTIDGSAAGGSLRLDASPTHADGVSVSLIGGSANDTLTAGLGGILGGVRPPQLVNGGRGGDLINLGGGHGGVDIVVYKSALDSQLDLSTTTTAGASATDTPNTLKMDVVTGFLNNNDTVDLTAFALTGQQAVIADKGAVADDAALVALAGLASFFRDAANVLRAAAEVHQGADTFLFVDANKDGVFTASADLVVKFVGLAAIGNADLLH